MNPWVIFSLGVAAGSLVSLVALALAQASGRVPSFAKEDAVREESRQQLDRINETKESHHALIEELTRDELAAVLRGECTLDDIVRSRALDAAARRDSSDKSAN